ncbi:MAG: cysteine dioxygenase [Azospirillaceae bacterium]|nr:cysteine dioxygenase [Azospirillaceae bacterium]
MTFTPLRDFVTGLTALIDQAADEPRILAEGGALLAALVAHDGWLPATHSRPDPAFYQQYLLYADPAQRFSVVSFVWGPGQQTPIHDHTVWGLIGMLRGAEDAQSFSLAPDGRPLASGPPVRLIPGQVAAVSPRIGDIHRVSNAQDDAVSISIHVYGANIGTVRRSVLTEDGVRKPFVSGYGDAPIPDLRGPSKEHRPT